VLEYLDGVSVHPYREESPPETALMITSGCVKLIEQSATNEAKKGIPIISGEWATRPTKWPASRLRNKRILSRANNCRTCFKECDFDLVRLEE
jgi:hypothetical protein